MFSFVKKTVAVFFLTFTGIVIPHALAEDPASELMTRIQSIEQQAKQIEANQKEILTRQEKILAEIDRIRVWTRRT